MLLHHAARLLHAARIPNGVQFLSLRAQSVTAEPLNKSNSIRSRPPFSINENRQWRLRSAMISATLTWFGVGGEMIDQDSDDGEAKLVEEIISIQRNYYFEKRNVKTERQRKIRELIEKASKTELSDGN